MSRFARARIPFAITFLCCFMTSLPAAATPMTYSYDFSAGSFPAGAPVDPVTGDVTLTIDPSIGDSSGTVDDISINLTLSNPSSVGYVYDATNDRLIIGDPVLGVEALSLSSPDFYLVFFAPFSAAPVYSNLTYSHARNAYDGSTGSVTPRTTVPEPGALALLATGLVGVGNARSRRTRKAGA